MLYSVRMRAAEGCDRVFGGRHISGAERLVPVQALAAVTQEMMIRATGHSRGIADFIQITVEKIETEHIWRLPMLSVTTVSGRDATAGRRAALEVLETVGITATAAEAGMRALTGLVRGMRGAMVLCAVSGKRLDTYGDRGIRVSRMDAADQTELAGRLERQGLVNIHVKEALVLATKVAAAPGMMAELCWSDDPDYTAGYVAAGRRYFRFPHLKEYGDPVGGRVFFVDPAADMEKLADYLERQPVLVISGGEEGQA